MGDCNITVESSEGCMETPLEDFDVLCVVDNRMRWYLEDRHAFAAAIKPIVDQHKRTLFVGASMGGFGALWHGSSLADAVLAFGPQGRLDHATMRPPPTYETYEELSSQLRQSIRAGRARGAMVEVHCAADEHCWHALSMPLSECALTVHPVLPRRPFARFGSGEFVGSYPFRYGMPGFSSATCAARAAAF